MRILTVTNLYPWPGQPARGQFNVQTVRELSRHHTVGVRVLVPEWRIWRWGGIRRWRSPAGGVDTAYQPVFYLPGIGRSLSHLTYRWSLRGDVGPEIRKSDVVLVPWIYPDGAAMAGLACDRGRPVWLMALGSDTLHLNAGPRPAILKACDQAQGVICVCRLLADRLANAGVPEAKLQVVPNGADTSLFRYRSRDEAWAELGKPETRNLKPESENRELNDSRLTSHDSRCILFVGNLVKVKGPDILLKAFSQIVAGRSPVSFSASTDQEPGTKNQEPGTRNQEPRTRPPLLILIGSGPLRRQLERQARDLGIAGSVHFLGSRSHEEVAWWMNAADVLCLPSRNEGMPNVVIEALVSGLPVVAADVGACREMLADEPAARVCRPDDAPGFARALEDLLQVRTDRPSMARRQAGGYSWRRQAEAIAALIQPEGHEGGLV
jgi:teichuronic acid biosynthesis glycosyltransferase TuaC